MQTRNGKFICGLILVASGTLQAAERKIQEHDLPAAVQQTLQSQSQGAVIKSYSTEVENGKTVYEAETMVDGHSRNLQVAADGTLNEIEEEVAFATLPAKVQSALTSYSRSASIEKVESLTKAGKVVAYEASTLNGKIKGEIQVGPNGKRLMH